MPQNYHKIFLAYFFTTLYTQPAGVPLMPPQNNYASELDTTTRPNYSSPTFWVIPLRVSFPGCCGG